ncbi:MAG: class I SAM-dependent RNA methyltransferase [Acidobacteria bacterium]|nr:class I SAM-dependent RNA methyltransferase [Acidobacteriota bacterium]
MTDERAVLRIEKLVGGGAGLAHGPDGAWFIRGALPGELVQAVVTKRAGRVTHAMTLGVVEDPSPLRDPAPCPHAGTCGGCDWPHVRADREANLKADVAAEAAGKKRGRLAEALRAAPVTPSPRAYRLRARLHWDPGRRCLGFYRARSREAVSIEGCRILSPTMLAALEPLGEALAGACPQPADVEWLENLDGSAAIAALRPSKGGDGHLRRSWVPARTDAPSPLVGFHLLSRSGRLRPVWGTAHVMMQLPKPLVVPVGSFFQGNRHLVPWLFRRVTELVGPTPVPVWDLHAGVGFLAAAALEAAPRPLTLVESYGPASVGAASNFPGVDVFGGWTAEEYLQRHTGLPREALVITDPPRSGLSPMLSRRLAEWRPDRILMLGCDPATWARDAGFLLDHGYTLTHLELVDLFPTTHHVEVLAMLESP